MERQSSGRTQPDNAPMSGLPAAKEQRSSQYGAPSRKDIGRWAISPDPEYMTSPAWRQTSSYYWVSISCLMLCRSPVTPATWGWSGAVRRLLDGQSALLGGAGGG
jgi:hypothetical protein